MALPMRSNHSSIPKDNTHLIPDEMMELEQSEFKKRVSQKHRDIMDADRLVQLRMQAEYIDDPNHWWNKLQTMSDADIKLMPMSFIMKYGSYITNMRRFEKEFHLEENKVLGGYFSQVKTLKKLQTDEEKALMLEEFRRCFEPDVVTIAGLVREEGDYMKRQPRVKPAELSYNFEQYGRYSRMLARASRLDDQKSKTFYKMVKYVKKNKDHEGDNIVHNFTVNKGYDPDLIEIPAEFEDLSIADVNTKEFAKKQTNKKLVRTRTSRDMTKFDVWRCHDRSVFMSEGRHSNVARLLLAPADLMYVFGQPDGPSNGILGTGEFNFEDTNLDCYKLYDHKQTDNYHGFNREDSYYTHPKNLRKPFHRRKRKYPSVSEFWSSKEPVVFKLAADDNADLPKFRRWFKVAMRDGLAAEKSMEEHLIAKFEDKIDICQGDWNEKGVINTDMAVHKLDASQFMSEEELKEYPHGPVTLCVPPKFFPLKDAKRVQMTREQIQLQEQTKEALKEEVV